eukprot:1222496-Amphidinium_carterae.1
MECRKTTHEFGISLLAYRTSPVPSTLVGLRIPDGRTKVRKSQCCGQASDVYCKCRRQHLCER